MSQTIDWPVATDFREQVLTKRPYISLGQRVEVVSRPDAVAVQPDKRVRHWRIVVDARDGLRRALRVVPVEDGRTIHNAFFDRNVV